MELNQIPLKPPGLKVYAPTTVVALKNTYFDYVTVALNAKTTTFTLVFWSFVSKTVVSFGNKVKIILFSLGLEFLDNFYITVLTQRW